MKLFELYSWKLTALGALVYMSCLLLFAWTLKLGFGIPLEKGTLYIIGIDAAIRMLFSIVGHFVLKKLNVKRF